MVNTAGGAESGRGRTCRALYLRIGLALAAGLLLPLAFPPFGLWPLVIVVHVLLYLVVRGATTRTSFYLGLLFGLVGYGLSLHWFALIFGSGAIALFALLALFAALGNLIASLATRRFASPLARVAAVSVVWTAVEFFRCELFVLRFPWITPGTALGPTWLSPMIGAYGVSLLVILAAAALCEPRLHRPGWALAAGLCALGLLRPGPVSPGYRPWAVAVVQSEECDLQQYLHLTEEALAREPADLVVWPEYALPYDVRDRPADLAAVLDLCRTHSCTIVLGTKTVTGGGPRDWHNTALTVQPDGVKGEYYKARPVHFFNDGIAGTEATPIPAAMATIGTPVCFDCDYTAVARALVRRGTDALVVPVFDARQWGRIQHLQHAELLRLRAAENGRWIVSAASSGVSQIVDPHGNVHAALEPMKEGTLRGYIGVRSDQTVFTRAGWVLPWLVLAGALGVALTVGLPQRVRIGRSAQTDAPRQHGLNARPTCLSPAS